MKNKEFLRGFLLALLLCAAGIFCYYSVLHTINRYQDSYEKIVYTDYEQKVYSRLHKVFQLLDGQCIFDYSEEELLQELTRTAMNSVHDKYTKYIEPKQEDALDFLSGPGIEVCLDEEKKQWLISDVIIGSDAENKVQIGDELLEINHQQVEKLTADEIKRRLYGDVDEKVSLTLRREGVAEPFVLELERAYFNKNTVYFRKVKEDIGYIQLVVFELGIEYQFKKAYNSLLEQGVKGIILDVRNNPGGSVDSAMNLCSLFLDEMPLFYFIHKDGTKEEYCSEDGAWEMPLVCMINEKSASSSEIFAGVLQYYKRAELVGVQSFGKGIAQREYALDNHTYVQVTIARVYYPDGSSIHGVGLTPDYVVEAEEEAEDWKEVPLEKDAQLQKAIMVMQEKLSGK